MPSQGEVNNESSKLNIVRTEDDAKGEGDVRGDETLNRVLQDSLKNEVKKRNSVDSLELETAIDSIHEGKKTPQTDAEGKGNEGLIMPSQGEVNNESSKLNIVRTEDDAKGEGDVRGDETLN